MFGKIFFYIMRMSCDQNNHIVCIDVQGVWPPPLMENWQVNKVKILTAIDTSEAVVGLKMQAGVSKVV